MKKPNAQNIEDYQAQDAATDFREAVPAFDHEGDDFKSKLNRNGGDLLDKLSIKQDSGFQK